MLFTVLSVLAHAEPTPDAAEPAGKAYRYLEREEIEFDVLDIEGELVKPEALINIERRQAGFNPLIRLRTDWNAEMKASIDDVG